MKSILTVTVAVGVLVVPALSAAHGEQDRQGERRTQVQTQVRQLADAGYRGRGDETTYPSDVQAAQERAGRMDGQGTPVDTSGYGPRWDSHSESGSREQKGPGSLYFGV